MNRFSKLLLTTLIGTSLVFSFADACSRFTYADDSGSVITARSMDWSTNLPGELHVFKRGTIRKNLTAGSTMPTWEVKHGSVGIYNLGTFTSAGMNEAGLAVDLLYLETADYGQLHQGETALAIQQLEQFLLDTCATADEVESKLKNEKIRPVKEGIIGNKMPMHLMVTDRTGTNAVIEWVDGKLNIHKQKGKMVMTNDPSYDKMLAIRDYYREVGIENSMPGSALSQARFVYIDGWLNQMTDAAAEDYISGIAGQDIHAQKLAGVLSIIRGVSTPVGIVPSSDMSHPNNDSTIWRTMADLKNNIFYYDSALVNTFIWVDVNKVDFTKEQYLPISEGQVLHGDMTDKLIAKKPQ